MKYYNLHIDFEPSHKTYQSVSDLLGVEPMPYVQSKWDEADAPSLWTYQIQNEEDVDDGKFINRLIDIVEPQFAELAQLGICRENILIWLVYEYTQQCALGFSTEELRRIADSGVAFNIDCFDMTHTKEKA